MSSKTVETRARTTKDGRLNLSVDVDVADAEVEVVLTVTPVTAGSPVDENGWPVGFFDRVGFSAGAPPRFATGNRRAASARMIYLPDTNTCTCISCSVKAADSDRALAIDEDKRHHVRM